MIHKLTKKYFSIVFIVATMIGVLHHHDDLKPHNDCKICTIQANIVDADTPSEAIYLPTLEIANEAIVGKLSNLHEYIKLNTFQARAPPLSS